MSVGTCVVVGIVDVAPPYKDELEEVEQLFFIMLHISVLTW
jgi:hypothetical protein